jgi:hypothetical protein
MAILKFNRVNPADYFCWIFSSTSLSKKTKIQMPEIEGTLS